MTSHCSSERLGKSCLFWKRPCSVYGAACARADFVGINLLSDATWRRLRSWLELRLRLRLNERGDGIFVFLRLGPLFANLIYTYEYIAIRVRTYSLVWNGGDWLRVHPFRVRVMSDESIVYTTATGVGYTCTRRILLHCGVPPRRAVPIRIAHWVRDAASPRTILV